MSNEVPSSILAYVEEASRTAQSEVSPFWLSDNEEIQEEGLYQLSFELDRDELVPLLEGLPAGYKIVHSIFTWEQSRAGEGFATGVENSGPLMVEAAASSYDFVGMHEEATALRAMLKQCKATPDDFEKVNAAYESVSNPYKEDWDRIPHLVQTLCSSPERYFHHEG